jgi:signal transduction histidine kinase
MSMRVLAETVRGGASCGSNARLSAASGAAALPGCLTMTTWVVALLLGMGMGIETAFGATADSGAAPAAQADDRDNSPNPYWFDAAGVGLPLGLLCLLLLRARHVWQASRRELEAANHHLQSLLCQRTSALASSAAALQRMATNLELTREVERVRIARELHDELGATLTVLKLELAGSPVCRGRDTPARQCRACAKLVDDAMDVLHRVVADLRPSALDHHGLWEAMRWKAQQYEKSTQIECRVEIPEDLPQPTDDVAIAIFRVFEETLTNVARHADARSVHISVQQTAQGLAIEVEDDGCGINPEQLPGARSFGLMGMHERATGVGGKLHIGRGSYGGTVTRFQLPPSSLHAPH